MDRAEHPTAPVSGSCRRCGCALGYAASRRDGVWYCCGACSGSDRCSCGCRKEQARSRTSDVYVPTRRMFASCHPAELRVRDGSADRPRAFPFADRHRGR